MTTIYKLTDEKMQTYGGCQWILGEPKKTSGEGRLCGPGWLHAYTDPLIAVLMNPIHANFSRPRLFLAEGSGQVREDHGLNVGFTEMTLIHELALPVISTEARVKFAILCALEVCEEKHFLTWANIWLSGSDRSALAAKAAAARAAAKAAAALAALAAAMAAKGAAETACRQKKASPLDLPALAKRAMAIT